MNIAQIKNIVKEKYAKTVIAVSVALATTSAYASVDVSDVVQEIKDAKTPIASVAGASLGAYVAIRVWKLVRRAI